MTYLIGKTIISATTVGKCLRLGLCEAFYMDIYPRDTGWLVYSDPEVIVGKVLKSLVMNFRLQSQESLPECFMDLPYLDRMTSGSPRERFSWKGIDAPYQWQPHHLQFEDGTEFLIVECMPSIPNDYEYVLVHHYQNYDERTYIVNPTFMSILN